MRNATRGGAWVQERGGWRVARGSLTALAALVALVALTTAGCDEDEGGNTLLPQLGSFGVSVADDLPAPWRITGPVEQPLEGVGSVAEIEVPAGEYTIHWEPLVGYTTPDDETFTVRQGQFTLVRGAYSIPPATSPDGLMSVFVAAYRDRNEDAYAQMLAEDFLFVPADDGPAYDREAEIALAEKMFNEVAGDGGIAIADIWFDGLEPLQVWEQVPPDDPDFGGFTSDAWRRAYTMDLRYAILGQNLILRVQGVVVIYARAAAGGEYELLGFRDLTDAKAVENHTWTEIRRLWD